MPKTINKANLYLLAWAVYDSQGILFPKGSLFTQLLIVVLLLVSLYYMFIANSRYKLPIYFCGLNLLLGMFFLYGGYLIIGGYNPSDYVIPISRFEYLKAILISLTPIYPIYVFSKEGLIDEKTILIWFVVIFGLTIGNFFVKQRELLYAAILNGSRAEEFTNNVGYDFLALIPFCVFFYRKPLLQYIFWGACLIFLFMAMKRGAVVIGVLCLFWALWNNLKNASFKKKIGVVALSLVLCFVGYKFVEKQMHNSYLFQKRIEKTLDGDSSGRDRLYNRFADYFWNETSPVQFVFGSGANATLKVGSNYAHNDWLEIAVNQGFAGMAIFLLYWILFAKNVFFRKHSYQEKLVLQLILLSTFMQTIFSMSYRSMGYIPMLTLGFCLAQEEK